MRSGFSECKSGCKEAFKCCELVDSGNRGAFMEVTRREGKKRDKGKGNKDDGRNSNASLKQSESISVFVLLSLGSLNSEERQPCVELVCVQAFRGILCV